MTTNAALDRADAGGDDEAAMLRRVLELVSQKERKGRVELVIAIVLSLATLSSTWCGYQASVWGGKSGGAQSGADTAERQAAENTIVALQIRTQDGLRLLEYWREMRESDQESIAIMEKHLPDRLRVAIQASVEAGILRDPNVPGPLQRPEYVIPEEALAKAQRGTAARLSAEAQVAGRRSSEYVLLTLMFASVLFFGGISSTIGARRIRTGLAGVAVVLFLLAFVSMLALPAEINA